MAAFVRCAVRWRYLFRTPVRYSPAAGGDAPAWLPVWQGSFPFLALSTCPVTVTLGSGKHRAYRTYRLDLIIGRLDPVHEIETTYDQRLCSGRWPLVRCNAALSELIDIGAERSKFSLTPVSCSSR